MNERGLAGQTICDNLMDIAVGPDKIVLNLGEITGNIWMTKVKEHR